MSLVKEESTMFIAKIGGSLITNKNGYCSPRLDKIQEFATLIKSNWDKLEGNLVIVLGGGSYGNAVPLRYGISNSQAGWEKINLLKMTEKMFEWNTVVTSIFRNEGVPCYPFQTSSYCTSSNGTLDTFYLEPIKMCLDLGILPILSGDLTFDKGKTFVIYSSDNVPEMFVEKFKVERVVMLTDVPGIYTLQDTKRIVRKVNKENFAQILDAAGSSSKQDITGGMNNKLRSMIRVAKKNTTSVICDGTNPQNLLEALFSSNPPGTIIEAWNEGSQ
jgi:isopentenyl phosphate kinase